MEIDPKYQAKVAAELSAGRRAIATQSPQAFAHVYLAGAFDLPPCRMHRELFAALLEVHAARAGRLALGAPRDHAKSTIATLAFPLWSLLCKREPLILLVSGTDTQATELLQHVRRQLEENPLLLADFPELADAKKSAPWRKGALLLPTGEMIRAYSANQNPRGIRNGKQRPTLIIADDLEDRNSVLSQDQRSKLHTWFNATLINSGTAETRVVVVGNVLHDDSLMANLLDPAISPMWRAMRYQAVEKFCPRQDLWDFWGRINGGTEKFEEETGAPAAKRFLDANRAAMLAGTQVLWPQRYSYEDLMRKRMDGEGVFQAEFQNEPMDPETCIFARAKMSYWDDVPLTSAQFLKRFGFAFGRCHPGEFFGACDPSLGRNPEKGDYTAIVILFRPSNSNVCYVIEADIERWGPEAAMNRITQLCKIYPVRRFVVETNQFQQILYSNLKCRLEAETYCTHLMGVDNRTNKQQRIMGLEPEIIRGRLVFSRQHQRLLQQMRAFPGGKNDDGPDALEMAVASAHRRYGAWRIQWP